MRLLSALKKNAVLQSMVEILDVRREALIGANQRDLALFDPSDRAMYDRLVINDAKVDSMIQAVTEVHDQDDPIGKLIHQHERNDGMRIENRTAPFGTILIIYESRPDVTIEAAMVAFKSNNKILLKGGKEAVHSNRILVDCWHQALEQNDLSKDWVQL